MGRQIPGRSRKDLRRHQSETTRLPCDCDRACLRLDQRQIGKEQEGDRTSSGSLDSDAQGGQGSAVINIPFPYVTYFATIISLLVVITVSLESVYHYREQW